MNCVLFPSSSDIFTETVVYMKQKILVSSPMGNCFTCFKVPPPGEPQPTESAEKTKEGNNFSFNLL